MNSKLTLTLDIKEGCHDWSSDIHVAQHVATHQTHSAVLVLLTVPRLNSYFYRRSFLYAAPVSGSTFADILPCNSESGFKRCLKTIRFTPAFMPLDWLLLKPLKHSIWCLNVIKKYYCRYYYLCCNTQSSEHTENYHSRSCDFADVWLSYIELESSHERGKPENIAHLHWRAVKDIDPQLVDEFRQRASALHTGTHTTVPSWDDNYCGLSALT